jgi:hypothetical protein
MHGSRIDAALRGTLGVTLSLLALLWAMPVSAHKASDAYLQWRQEGQLVALRWDVAVRDLQALMPLDSDDDGRITWGELKAHQAEIDAYMLSHVRLRMASQVDSARANAKKASEVAQTCHLRPVHTQGRALDAAPLERRGDGAYYVLRLTATCTPASRALQVSYRFMQEVDPTHRGLLSRQGGSDGPVSLVPDGRWVTLQQTSARLSMMDTPSRSGLTQAGSPLRRASYVPEIAVAPAALSLGVPAVAEAAEPPSRWQLLRDGVHHILIGTDHVLFLICLLLPAVLVRKIGPSGIAALAPVPHARQALAPVLGAVTMFTIAHSITLGLAGLGWVRLSPRVVEPGIALTIALAAIDNVKPIFQGRRHLFTFLFGLVHGFGFAGVLAELNLPTSGFAWALLEFNVGVELGQLLVLVPAMAVLLPMRHWKAYPRQFMPAASLLALLVALGWWVERVFDLGFMPI